MKNEKQVHNSFFKDAVIALHSSVFSFFGNDDFLCCFWRTAGL